MTEERSVAKERLERAWGDIYEQDAKEDTLGKPVPVESLLDEDDFAVIREEQASSLPAAICEFDGRPMERTETGWICRWTEEHPSDQAHKVEDRSAAQTCEFGCGPDDDSYVRPGFTIVPACPVHGWMVGLLNERAGGREEYETEEIPRPLPSRFKWRRWLHV